MVLGAEAPSLRTVTPCGGRRGRGKNIHPCFTFRSSNSLGGKLKQKRLICNPWLSHQQ